MLNEWTRRYKILLLPTSVDMYKYVHLYISIPVWNSDICLFLALYLLTKLETDHVHFLMLWVHLGRALFPSKRKSLIILRVQKTFIQSHRYKVTYQCFNCWLLFFGIAIVVKQNLLVTLVTGMRSERVYCSTSTSTLCLNSSFRPSS